MTLQRMPPRLRPGPTLGRRLLPLRARPGGLQSCVLGASSVLGVEPGSAGRRGQPIWPRRPVWAIWRRRQTTPAHGVTRAGRGNQTRRGAHPLHSGWQGPFSQAGSRTIRAHAHNNQEVARCA
jgi:hypothetical protein